MAKRRDITELKRAICQSIDRRMVTLIELSHSVHATPELAFEEWKSSAMVAAAAEEAGLIVQRGAFGLPTALAAEFGEGDHAVAVLSEYDALPDVGHACGHNIIATIGLGAALALRDLGADLPGRIRWLGTPAEERGCGKEIMARHGAFEGVSAALMVHPAGINAKAFRAACLCELEAVFKGRSAHPAINPSDGRNALDAAIGSYQAMAALRQHLPAGDQVSAVLTEGGRAPNVIPHRSVLRVFVRAPDAERLRTIKARVEACMTGGAVSAGCEVECHWNEADYLSFKINEPLADAYELNARQLGRDDFVPVHKLPVGGGDIGNVSHRVPTLHALISCSPRSVRLHDPEFATWAKSERGDRAALEGAKALAMTAIDFLSNAKVRSAAEKAFAEDALASKRAIESAWRSSGASERGRYATLP